MKAQFVLDASALLSILLDEPGHENVPAILDRSRIHSVNLAEVVARLVRFGMPAESAVATLHQLHLEVVVEFGAAQAEFCGALLGACPWVVCLPDGCSFVGSGGRDGGSQMEGT